MNADSLVAAARAVIEEASRQPYLPMELVNLIYDMETVVLERSDGSVSP